MFENSSPQRHIVKRISRAGLLSQKLVFLQRYSCSVYVLSYPHVMHPQPWHFSSAMQNSPLSKPISIICTFLFSKTISLHITYVELSCQSPLHLSQELVSLDSLFACWTCQQPNTCFHCQPFPLFVVDSVIQHMAIDAISKAIYDLSMVKIKTKRSLWSLKGLDFFKYVRES